MRTGGRPSLGLSPAEMKARRLEQARTSKANKKALRAVLSENTRLCSKRWCLDAATLQGMCRYHAGIETSKNRKCIHCDNIAMPGSTLCGYCQELSEERRAETRRQNKSAMRERIRQINKERVTS